MKDISVVDDKFGRDGNRGGIAIMFMISFSAGAPVKER